MGSDGLSAFHIYNLPHRINIKSYNIRIFVSLHIVPFVDPLVYRCVRPFSCCLVKTRSFSKNAI